MNDFIWLHYNIWITFENDNITPNDSFSVNNLGNMTLWVITPTNLVVVVPLTTE